MDFCGFVFDCVAFDKFLWLDKAKKNSWWTKNDEKWEGEREIER